MVAVPADTPDTTPEVTGAIGVLLLLHTPPDTLLLSDVVLPIQAVAEPVIVPALGNGLTVTIRVAIALPQLLVTV